LDGIVVDHMYRMRWVQSMSKQFFRQGKRRDMGDVMAREESGTQTGISLSEFPALSWVG
jgi:hypothetical protein